MEERKQRDADEIPLLVTDVEVEPEVDVDVITSESESDYESLEYSSEENPEDVIPEVKELPTTKFSIHQLESLKKNNRAICEVIVPPEKRQTSQYIQQTEFTELIGIRAQHISEGAELYVNPEKLVSPIDIAKKELRMGKFPFLLKRYVTPRDNTCIVEIWNPNEMAIPPSFYDH